jgi:hypothetical protein
MGMGALTSLSNVEEVAGEEVLGGAAVAAAAGRGAVEA